MATTGVFSGTHQSRRRAVGIATIIVLGILGGGVVYYATAVVGTAHVPGEFTTNPVILAALAVLVAFSIAAGWRWPRFGVSAGSTMTFIILFAVLQRVSWSSASPWLDPFESVGYGAVSGYPAMIAAAFLAASALRLRSNRKHQ